MLPCLERPETTVQHAKLVRRSTAARRRIRRRRHTRRRPSSRHCKLSEANSRNEQRSSKNEERARKIQMHCWWPKRAATNWRRRTRATLPREPARTAIGESENQESSEEKFKQTSAKKNKIRTACRVLRVRAVSGEGATTRRPSIGGRVRPSQREMDQAPRQKNTIVKSGAD
jgi:hypothetical protein